VTSDERVEAALRELGGRLAVPEPPADLAAIVLARLDEPERRPRPGLVRVPRRLVTRVAAVVVALLVALALAMVVSPTVRAAVYDLFHLGGVEIHYAPPPVPPSGSDVPLPGERNVSLAQARAAVRFDVRVPALLGNPDSVRVVDSDDGGPPRVVSLRYRDARVDEIDGRISPVFEKFTHAEDVVRTDVDGAPAVWIPRPNSVIYVDEHGRVHEESAHLAATTLIWERDGVTYRVEGQLSERQAALLAESLR
jgi:hypothetical protein